MLELSELQKDALCEIFNISVGQAASTMSLMMDEEVLLSVPEVQFLSIQEAALLLDHMSQRICGIRQNFSGHFQGNALLIFPEARSLELVRLMVGKQVRVEQLTELEQDALAEVGNIILNACLASLSDIFQSHFNCSLPVLHIGTGASLLDQCSHDQLVMVLHIRFTLATQQLQGYVIFVMNSDSLSILARSVDEFISGLAAPGN